LVRNVPVADVPEPPQLKSRAGVPDGRAARAVIEQKEKSRDD
jgi:hypothetical protein